MVASRHLLEIAKLAQEITHTASIRSRNPVTALKQAGEWDLEYEELSDWRGAQDGSSNGQK